MKNYLLFASGAFFGIAMFTLAVDAFAWGDGLGSTTELLELPVFFLVLSGLSAALYYKEVK